MKETTGNWGTVQYDTATIQIYSSNYSPISSRIVDGLQTSSQLGNGYFILPSFIPDNLSFKAAIVDSTFNITWENGFSSPSLTPCVVNPYSFLLTIKKIALFSVTDSIANGNFSLKSINIVNGGMIHSPSYSQSDSTIYIGTVTGKISAYKLSNLKESKWEYQTDDTISTSIIITSQNDLIFGCSNNNLYSLNSYGELNWKFPTDEAIKSTPALGLDSSIVFGTENGTLYKLTQSGEKLWEFQTGSSIKSDPVIDFYGNIYVGSSDGIFYALNPNGKLNWQYKSNSKKECYASIGRNGLIYVNAEPNMMLVFDRFGNINWYFEFQTEYLSDEFGFRLESLFKAPLVTNNNLILLQTNGNKLFLLKDSSIQDSLQYLRPQWSTFKGSNQRTGMSYLDMVTSVENNIKNQIIDFQLEQNYPNPFNPVTTIEYFVPKQSKVLLTIFNILGEKILTLVNEEKAPGKYSKKFDATGLATGIYFYKLQSGNFIKIKKLMLLK